MKYFPPLRLARITAEIGELTIGEAIKLAAIPEHILEASCTAFLRCAVKSAKGIEDPLQWTVQERSFAVAHYMASISDEGPDFSLGVGKFTDYLDGESDKFVGQVEIGRFADDDWTLHQLTGAMAESIERLVGEIDMPRRLHWILGAMAAQLTRRGESIPDIASEGEYDEWLLNRMRVFGAFPESEFELLMGGFFIGMNALHHLFAIYFDDKGIVVLPKKGADGGLPPARFPVLSCLSRTAHDLA